MDTEDRQPRRWAKGLGQSQVFALIRHAKERMKVILPTGLRFSQIEKDGIHERTSGKKYLYDDKII
jgi:hypothetical protein